ncbi:efflux RND transporter periplasmic adaptor subunit [Sinorhizobium sp. BG8]|uniref:efflux RND transporter periplasmic adaptor subunit n=1 Tax=Sinorhizobium sp. BG8 TaxID=2613773 RepID=UPI00193DDE94|nr:efflux RND transporter periplasmic adaptor subunit [Sinorhizobium sp. BG8]QRM56498.1 efflux RND transporter periplasmic adaptor subunit [Sinorhizobium sp. BG8]
MARGYTNALRLSVALLLATTPAASFAADAVASVNDTDQVENLPAIVVTEAKKQKIVDRVIATGTIQPVQEIYVAPLVEGLSIRTLEADVGDKVEAGDVLATLNDDALVLEKSHLEATLARANASQAQIEAQLVETQRNAEEAIRVRDRTVKLAKSGSQSQAAADEATTAAAASEARVSWAERAVSVSQADIKMVEAQIADIELKLKRTAVKTPVAGVISARTAKVGAIAAGNAEPMFSLIRDGEIELKADVSEEYIQKLAPGQKATVTLTGGHTKLAGSIRLIEPTLDAQTRLGRVFIRIEQPEKARAGMFASAEIIAEEKDGLVLPLSAVTTSRSQTVARRVKDGVVEMVKVETGIQDGEVIEIVDGLAAGDEVVAKAGAYVRDGDRIKPVKAASAATN